MKAINTFHAHTHTARVRVNHSRRARTTAAAFNKKIEIGSLLRSVTEINGKNIIILENDGLYDLI